MHLQCDVIQCNGACVDMSCDNTGVKDIRPAASPSEENVMLAATTVFVLDPSEAPRKFVLLFVLFIFRKYSCS